MRSLLSARATISYMLPVRLDFTAAAADSLVEGVESGVVCANDDSVHSRPINKDVTIFIIDSY